MYGRPCVSGYRKSCRKLPGKFLNPLDGSLLPAQSATLIGLHGLLVVLDVAQLFDHAYGVGRLFFYEFHSDQVAILLLPGPDHYPGCMELGWGDRNGNVDLRTRLYMIVR